MTTPSDLLDRLEESWKQIGSLGHIADRIYRLPEDDGNDDQVETAGAIALIVEAAVAQVYA
jgi:hypothetical protein